MSQLALARLLLKEKKRKGKQYSKLKGKKKKKKRNNDLAILPSHNNLGVTNFIQSYLHQIFDYFHGLKASLKPLRRPFDRCQSRLEAINIG